MTTISFEKETSFSRNNFVDVKDFLLYVLENYKFQDEKVEFGVLNDSEITPSLRKKIEDVKSGKIKFVNL